MLQEHWLFKCQLTSLEEIHEDFTGCGKSVDNTDPLLPSHLPRGYGGVCILWRKTIDHLVTPLEIGNNRVQAIELQNKHDKNFIIITVYMPCKDTRIDKILEFLDCVEHLHSICSMYRSTHHIILGGDINENILK